MLSILTSVAAFLTVNFSNPIVQNDPKTHVLAHHELSLEDRYGNAFVNHVFSDNILITLLYMQDRVKKSSDITPGLLQTPFHFRVTLQPHEVFAFHDRVLPEFAGKVAHTTHAHFMSSEGFESDGWLVADGVCHIASLMNWTAKDAGLLVDAPTKHDFAVIPDIPKEYGTAIFDTPADPNASKMQNLYITNNQEKPVEFDFDYKNNVVTLAISEIH